MDDPFDVDTVQTTSTEAVRRRGQRPSTSEGLPRSAQCHASSPLQIADMPMKTSISAGMRQPKPSQWRTVRWMLALYVAGEPATWSYRNPTISLWAPKPFEKSVSQQRDLPRPHFRTLKVTLVGKSGSSRSSSQLPRPPTGCLDSLVPDNIPL